MLIHMIGREEVVKGDISRIVNDIFNSIEEYKKSKKFIPILFGIQGWDDDPRPLLQIPEVRSWCKNLYERIPFLFSMLESETIGWLLPCIADIKIISQGKDMTKIKYGSSGKKFVKEIFDNGGKLLQMLAKSQEEFDRLAEEIGVRIRKGISIATGKK